MQNKIFTTIIRYSLPYIIIFALYIQINGSDGPGGGFQAGAILASAIILHSLVHGNKITLEAISLNFLKNLAIIGIILYIGTGVLCILKGGNFLDYSVLRYDLLPNFLPEELGITLIEWGIAFTVFSTLCLIYFSFSIRNISNHDTD
jgi:multicomponent Na+:H+ antiporter subunit B